MDKSPSQDNKPMNKVAEHTLTDGELAVFAEIFAAYKHQRLAITKYICEKHGYPEKDPLAFQFNWQNKTVAVFRPESKLEIAKELPNAPASSA